MNFASRGAYSLQLCLVELLRVQILPFGAFLCSALALKELHPLFFYPRGLTEFCCADQTRCLLWCCAKPVFPAHVYVTPALILMNYTFIKPEIHRGWQCRALLTSLLCERGRKALVELQAKKSLLEAKLHSPDCRDFCQRGAWMCVLFCVSVSKYLNLNSLPPPLPSFFGMCEITEPFSSPPCSGSRE